jgi:DNA polymerase III alpha subunit
MTDPPQYVELHAASAFSFLEGASQPEDLIKTAYDQGLSAIALLDRNGFYGSARFHSAAKLKGIKAHVGTEIAVAERASRQTLHCRISTKRSQCGLRCCVPRARGIKTFVSSSLDSRCARARRPKALQDWATCASSAKV